MQCCQTVPSGRTINRNFKEKIADNSICCLNGGRSRVKDSHAEQEQ